MQSVLHMRLQAAFLLLLVYLSGCAHAVDVWEVDEPIPQYPVPNIVHQTYDYKHPNYFMFLSMMSIQYFQRPDEHILWVNNEGRFKAGQWHEWTSSAKEGSWQRNLTDMFETNKIKVKMLPFPHQLVDMDVERDPPVNRIPDSMRRTDLLRIQVLLDQGGIYMDNDAFMLKNMDELRRHQYTMCLDNVVFEWDNLTDPHNTAKAPHTPFHLNNGVILSAPNASFLKIWKERYASFDNKLNFHWHSSIVPFQIAMSNIDLVHLESNRISPLSYGFNTIEAAGAITCGFLLPDMNGNGGTIWHPNHDGRSYTFDGVEPDRVLFRMMKTKLALHLTMSAVKNQHYSMIKAVLEPEDVPLMHSFLGSVFRTVLDGRDNYDYEATRNMVRESQATKNYKKPLQLWNDCRAKYHMVKRDYVEAKDKGPDKPWNRQHYIAREIPYADEKSTLTLDGS